MMFASTLVFIPFLTLRQAKSNMGVIGTGGILTALASGLGLGNLFPLTPILYERRHLNWAYVSMETLTMMPLMLKGRRMMITEAQCNARKF